MRGNIILFLYVIFGFLVGAWSIFIGLSGKDIFSGSVGIIIMLLMIFLFIAPAKARTLIISLAVSFLLFIFYRLCVMGLFYSQFYLVGALFYVPIALLSVISIILFSLPAVSPLFLKQNSFSLILILREGGGFWKIYFFCSLVDITYFNFSIFSSIKSEKDLFELIDLFLYFIALLGLFGLSWKIKIFIKSFWKIFILGFVFWNFFYSMFVTPNILSNYEGLRFGNIQTFYFLMLVSFLPLIISNIMYGFNSDKIWKFNRQKLS